VDGSLAQKKPSDPTQTSTLLQFNFGSQSVLANQQSDQDNNNGDGGDDCNNSGGIGNKEKEVEDVNDGEQTPNNHNEAKLFGTTGRARSCE
jgi:hypothetical protein